MSKLSYNIESAVERANALQSGLDSYIDAVEGLIKAKKSVSIDHKDKDVLEGLKGVSKNKKTLENKYLHFLKTKMKSPSKGIFEQLTTVEIAYASIFNGYSDPSSPIYKQIRGDAKATAYAQLSSIPVMDQLYAMHEAKGKSYDRVKGFLEAYEATFISGEYVKRVNGKIRYYGSNARIREVYGRNVRRSSFKTFYKQSFNKNNPLKELKGLSGAINYSEILYKGIKDLKEYSVTKDKVALEANLISRPVETAATIVAGSASTIAAEGFSIVVIGASTPVVVFVVGSVLIYASSKYVVSPAIKKLNKEIQKNRLQTWEKEGREAAIKKLKRMGIKYVDLSQFKEPEKGGYLNWKSAYGG